MEVAGLTGAVVGWEVAGGVPVAGQGVGEAVTFCAGAHENVESITAIITASVGRDGFIFFIGQSQFYCFFARSSRIVGNSIAIFMRSQIGKIRASGLCENEVEYARRLL
jgi:hypothetical protein